ncbi:MAG: DNA topoisomerase I [Candidatus Hydrothermarchaeota archaeon]
MKSILIITEKPKSSLRIASALADEKPIKRIEKKVPYYEFYRNGNKIFVCSAIGHLFTLKQSSSKWDYPVFDVEWIPRYQVNKRDSYVKNYANLIKKLAKKADEYIIATDYDIEGELLGYNILRFLCDEKKSLRMHFSTLTKPELIKAFNNLENLNYRLADAGECRHMLDWFYGINISRALSLSLKRSSNHFAILSTGRVQGPCLKILAEREKEIKRFKPKPFWVIYLVFSSNGDEFLAKHEKNIFTEREEAEKVLKECVSKTARVTEVSKKSFKQSPPYPFDLTSLQGEAYSKLGLSPTKTLSTAQSLYESGLISYPRTASQKLPPTIDYGRIIKSIHKNPMFNEFTAKLISKELKPNEGKKEDPAHPSIYPTGEMPVDLRRDELRLYKLIVHRFLSVFGDPAIKESVNIVLELDGHKFYLKGINLIEEGWLALYGEFAKKEEAVLPDLNTGDEILVKKVEIQEKMTKPPSRYNPASIIRELEKRGLGTKATRAMILDTLFKRGYIRGRQIEVTELGEAVVEVLLKHVPEIVSEELTREFEKKMNAIESGGLRKEDVIDEAKEKLTSILEKYKQKETKIGEELGRAINSYYAKRYILGKCHKCNGNLRIVRSRKTKKRFIGCSNYPECNESYPLPQRGRLSTANKNCPRCNLPMIRTGGRKIKEICPNPFCDSNKDSVSQKF